MGELERLRDVAHAAAALVKAQNEWIAACPSSYNSADDPTNGEVLTRIQQQADIYWARFAELTASLDRLTEPDPPA